MNTMVDTSNIEPLLAQFHFIRPLWLLAFIPMLFLLWLRWREENKPSWKDVLPEHLRQALTLGEQGWRRQLPLKLLVVIIGLAVIACAGPSWQRQASPFGEDKASMLVILDASDSMMQTDLPPNRLERAKHKIQDLMSRRNGGNTGLVVFAGSAHIAMPITQDSKVFTPFLSAISPEIMPIEGKMAEKALPLIEQQLKGELGSTVLLVTDGVNPTTIEAYQTYFADKPYQLLILAAGNTDIVSNSPVDMGSLSALAKVTSGHLIEVTIDNSDIETLNRYIERNMQLNGESSMPWQDMGYPLLAPIALLMLLWFRRGWLVQWCLVAAISATIVLPHKAVAETVSLKAKTTEQAAVRTMSDKVSQWWWDLWLTPNQQGQRWFNNYDYLEAAKHFTDPLRKGTAYYYAGEYKLAHSAFLEMQSGSSQAMQNIGLYNAASALARQREYLAARDVLQSLVETGELHPKLRADAEHNLHVINGIIQEINQMSESQAGTENDTSTELGENPQTAEGADEKTSAELLLKETLSASDILADQALADKWLKRVEADPKHFLRTKFQIQLRETRQRSTHSAPKEQTQ
ncbi:hypothetical protein GCM10007938_35970 [Vibrio zhanjiangensis]|uniref:VWFA domain-containing protein n=2 Tax=Vibrio zhanjiangensis TaxID=1046128 RepID=A0ABQ6F3J0_9VIBR|nr:hypothetical protein GCM10007938_35970 [Vibrio zhanjiangensis]